jgi:hypothetical protein
MAAKKVDAQSLTALRERAFSTHGIPTVFEFPLSMVWMGYRELDKVDPYVWQLLPVPLVTHLEVHFRTCIEHLIDAGEPFLSRAGELARNVGFNFAAVKALSGRSLTLGALIAHSLPFSDYSHLEGPMTCLLGDNFNDFLRNAYDRWEVEVKKKPKRPIIKDFDGTVRDLQRLFGVRHVVVHEVTNEPPFEEAELERFYLAAKNIIKASNAALSEVLYPNAPLQQSAMNEQAAKELTEETAELEAVLETLRTIAGTERTEQLDKTVAAWETFANLFAQFAADEYRGGRIAPLIYASEKRQLQKMLRQFLEPRAQPESC